MTSMTNMTPTTLAHTPNISIMATTYPSYGVAMSEPVKKIPVVIDRGTWRCGGIAKGLFAKGKGPTKLLNDEGYRCCLGFITSAAGYSDSDLLSHAAPSTVGPVPELTERTHPSCLRCSELTLSAIKVNDNIDTPGSVREQQLIKLFEKSRYAIEFTGKYADE